MLPPELIDTDSFFESDDDNLVCYDDQGRICENPDDWLDRKRDWEDMINDLCAIIGA